MGPFGHQSGSGVEWLHWHRLVESLGLRECRQWHRRCIGSTNGLLRTEYDYRQEKSLIVVQLIWSVIEFLHLV